MNASRLYPALRVAHWRGWLVAFMLLCTIGIYSIGATHHHKTLAAELACPVCQVMAHGMPSLLKPDLSPLLSYASWYRHAALPLHAWALIPLRPVFASQPRAPPVIAPSLV